MPEQVSPGEDIVSLHWAEAYYGGQLVFFVCIWGTGIRGLMRGMEPSP